ncbi:hypothetical protein SORBI_3008G090200 [Sorghum bicolor]|uniref:Uncharacterized protein n=1 Tax=Sorghum bicolor TaxID=4558 RepID=A0A1B6PCL4_SORBI|nr:hypothetical protein SORBI_3008G090200 [Sorghum bicolor]
MKRTEEVQWHKLKREPVENELVKVCILSYQDDDCEGVHVRVDDSVFENEQPISEDGVCVDACVVDELRLQREVEGEQDDSSDSEDETRCQYFSDNEGPRIPQEDDDDSDYE